MKIRALLLALLLCGAALATPARVVAQGAGSPRCSDQSGFAVGVTPSPISFTTPTAAHFNAGSPGYIAGPTVTLSFDLFQGVQSTTKWHLCLRYATGATDLGNGKALGDLLWSADGTNWTPVSTTTAVVHMGTGRCQNCTRTVYLRSLLRWATDTPFTYGQSLVFYGSF